MASVESVSDVEALRRRVRATQHVRSVPLLVIGALLVNYGVIGFGPSPVAWRFGAPLAFVLIWALGKANEAATGAGPGRGDYLVAAGFVFAATNLALLIDRLRYGAYMHDLFGLWIAIVGIALAVLSRGVRDVALLVAGCSVVGLGVVVGALGSTDFFLPLEAGINVSTDWSMELTALVGGALTLAGLFLYRRERRAG